MILVDLFARLAEELRELETVSLVEQLAVIPAAVNLHPLSLLRGRDSDGILNRLHVCISCCSLVLDILTEPVI